MCCSKSHLTVLLSLFLHEELVRREGLALPLPLLLLSLALVLILSSSTFVGSFVESHEMVLQRGYTVFRHRELAADVLR